MTEKTGETPLNGAFFLQSFFFAPVVPKKKRQCLSVDIISVSETAFSAAPSVARYRGAKKASMEPIKELPQMQSRSSEAVSVYFISFSWSFTPF